MQEARFTESLGYWAVPRALERVHVEHAKKFARVHEHRCEDELRTWDGEADASVTTHAACRIPISNPGTLKQFSQKVDTKLRA